MFPQRFTLDRAYGQDVEIFIPKSKSSSSKKKAGQPGFDPGVAAQDRYHTKMAAHISMEAAKLLRSGNLRVCESHADGSRLYEQAEAANSEG